jgi:hypothetical protein
MKPILVTALELGNKQASITGEIEMLRRRLCQLAIVSALFFGLVTNGDAGDISGVVKYKNGGGSASGVRISGLTAGTLGGATATVYSDNRGKFVLSWKSRGGLAKLYANGSVVAVDIRDGENVVVTLR